MSVLIRGMDEIPEDGAVLVVRHDNGKAYIKPACTYGYSMELVEIPEKHGRLIDADEMNRLWSGCYFNGSIKPLLDARPTVIEAEGAEE